MAAMDRPSSAIPYVPPPGAVIGEAKIIATNDFYWYHNNETAYLDVLNNDTAAVGGGIFRIKEVTASSLVATLTVAADGRSIL